MDGAATHYPASSETVVFLNYLKHPRDPSQLDKVTLTEPAPDSLGDILATADADQFQGCFVVWVAVVAGVPAGVIAVDNKAVRRSARKQGAKSAIHMVSAFAARQRLALGQVKEAEKSNEFVAIQGLSIC